MPKGLSLGANNRWWVIREHLRTLAPQAVLELGCGLGQTGSLIAQDFKYVGVEPDYESRSRAQAAVAAYEGLVVDAIEEVARNAQVEFDVVCAFEVLEHLEQPDEVVTIWLKSLRNQGAFIFSVPANSKRFSAWDRAVGHYRRYDAHDIEQFAKRLDLSIVDMRAVGWPLGWIGEWVRATVAVLSRNSPATKSDATARSGRWLQPGKRFGPLLFPVTALSRAIQPIGFKASKGNNWVVLCQRTADFE